MSDLFQSFDHVRIINLVERSDRRREMEDQLSELGAMGSNLRFYDAQRPSNAGEFPNLGARGCFESHLAVLREARDAQARSVLVLEDDFDFTRSGRGRINSILAELSDVSWDVFYGAHVLDGRGRNGLANLPPNEPVLTASFVAFGGRIIAPLVDFLEGIMGRPAGSPEYGPMHVDGAYTIFRELNPNYTTLAAFPTLGRQRSSASDITPQHTFLERWDLSRTALSFARRGYNSWRRRR